MTRGHRPVNAWGAGDLPAPYAIGDIIDVPDGAKALERMHGNPPGRYRISYATSIDDGDAWFFRVAPYGRPKQRVSEGSGHVVYADRTSQPCDEDLDWLAGCILVRTVDPDGLALRERMLTEGWTLPEQKICETCRRPL